MIGIRPWIEAQQVPMLGRVALFQEPVGQVEIEEAAAQLPTHLLELVTKPEIHGSPF